MRWNGPSQMASGRPVWLESAANNPTSPHTGDSKPARRRSTPSCHRSRSASDGPAPSRSGPSPASVPLALAATAVRGAPQERRPMIIPCSLANSWRITSALPSCRKKRSRSQSSSPSNALRRAGCLNGTAPPSRRYRRTVFRAHPNSFDRRLLPQPSSCSRSIATTSPA